jgi:hypothetical protein
MIYSTLERQMFPISSPDGSLAPIEIQSRPELHGRSS